MGYNHIKVDVTDRVCTIMFARPERRNAWIEPMRVELVDAFDQANRDPNVRVIILTGDPQGKAFCAGADLGGTNQKGNAFTNGTDVDVQPGRPANNTTFRDGGGVAALKILNSLKPVIAAMNGSAVGVGMTISCVCDIRVVASNAKVGFVFARRGLACESVSSWILPKLIGHGNAMELVMTGRVFNPNDAPPGLFNYVVTPDQVMSKAKELAKEIVENTSPMSVALSRLSLIRNGIMSPEEAHLAESRIIHHTSRNDALEGIKSFLEKRPPNFVSDPFKDMPEFHPWWRVIDANAKL